MIALWAAFSLSSCTESIDTAQQRRYDNEQAFTTFANNSTYERRSTPGLVGADAFVYMQWLERGAATVTAKQTDYVRVQYSGYLLTAWINNGGGLFESADLNVVKPRRVSEFIPGFSTALQNMVVGDKVSVIIPWYLAYGNSEANSGSQVTIPSYSALRFELTLLSNEGDTSDE